MAEKESTGALGRPTAEEEEIREQARVLRKVLFLYPEALTQDELIRELTVASTEFTEQEAARSAIRDLIAGGLLHRIDHLVLPTKAAVNFSVLAEL